MIAFLFLLAIAGVIAWIWNRMEVLERRVAELEGSMFVAHTSPPPVAADITRPRDLDEPDESDSGSDTEQDMERQPTPSAPPEAPISYAAATPAAAQIAELPADEQPAEEQLTEGRNRFLPSFDFEEIFGRLLPIWGGGIALAIAGFFLVRWSIETGLLGPTVRVALGFVFGALLLGAAELACRLEPRIRDVRVRQALAGAGLATLYASFYLAGTHYGLIGTGAAFAGLAGVTGLAIALSYRFGLPSAVLGLVGGFVAPALAGSADPNLPLLATYLALVTGGLCVTGQRQQRSWLGIAALVGGLGWGALMLLSGPLNNAGILAIGGYLILLGTIMPSILGAGPLGRIGRIAAAGLATFQIAFLVDQSGYSMLAWGCYLLLGLALAVLGLKHARLREASAMAAAISLWLLAAWPGASSGQIAAIAIAFAAIFAAAPLYHAWRGDAGPVDWGQLALYPIALVAALCFQLGLPIIGARDPLVALGALALALLPGLAAMNAWPAPQDDFRRGPFAALASSATLVMLAGLAALPAWCAPLVAAVLVVPAYMLLGRRTAAMPRALFWTVAISGLVLLIWTGNFLESNSLFGEGLEVSQWFGALRWLAAAIPFAVLLNGEERTGPRRIGEMLAALLGYGAMTMLVPAGYVPLAVAIAVLGLAKCFPQRGAALVTLLSVGLLWAAAPLAQWCFAGIEALAGNPVLLQDLPALEDMLRYVAPLAIGIGGAKLLGANIYTRDSRFLWWAAGLLPLAILHVAWKEIFALRDLVQFVELGLAERTIWQAILAFTAFTFWAWPKKFAAQTQVAQNRTAQAMAAAALGHFAIFSLLLHNPLWAEQAVGAWPLVNLLCCSYGLAITLVLWLRNSLEGPAKFLHPWFDAAVMGLIVLLSLSELRQIFAGSILISSPVSQQEDLLRSLLAIIIAVGLLGWGAWTKQRSWRIGSLILMLLAVLKVFIFDAAGLDGLARISSFFALGVCLIGIGWFYSKQLVTAEADDLPMATET